MVRSLAVISPFTEAAYWPAGYVGTAVGAGVGMSVGATVGDTDGAGVGTFVTMQVYVT